jgi:hypothetical protein
VKTAKSPNKKLRSAVKKRKALDFAKLAEKFRGMMKGPRDLSTREGY